MICPLAALNINLRNITKFLREPVSLIWMMKMELMKIKLTQQHEEKMAQLRMAGTTSAPPAAGNQMAAAFYGTYGVLTVI